MKKLLQATALGALLVTVAQAQVTLINDSFTDLARTNGADANDAQWRLLVGTTTETNMGGVTVTENYAATGSLVVRSNNSSFSGSPQWTAGFSSTTLAIGDTISMSFTYASTEDTSNATGLRFGFHNTMGTTQTSDLPGASANAIYQDDLSYQIWAPRDVANQPIQMFATNVAARPLDTSLITSSSNTAIPGTASTTTSTAGAAGPRTATFSLTRTATGYDYLSTYGGAVLSGSTTVVRTDTFDSIVLWSDLRGNLLNVSFDDVVVTYTAVPEPSTYAMIAGGLGLVGAIVVRRRRSLNN
jgi:hypothetical protein